MVRCRPFLLCRHRKKWFIFSASSIQKWSINFHAKYLHEQFNLYRVWSCLSLFQRWLLSVLWMWQLWAWCWLLVYNNLNAMARPLWSTINENSSSLYLAPMWAPRPLPATITGTMSLPSCCLMIVLTLFLDAFLEPAMMCLYMQKPWFFRHTVVNHLENLCLIHSLA